MKALYLLVVDKAWAKLYKTAHAAKPLALVYHQALFGSAQLDTAEADEDLARSLCRLLRADRLTGRYERLVLLGSPRMLAALHRQYDGNWTDVVTGQLADLPARYTDEDLSGWLQRRLAHVEQQPDAEEGVINQANAAAVTTQRQG